MARGSFHTNRHGHATAAALSAGSFAPRQKQPGLLRQQEEFMPGCFESYQQKHGCRVFLSLTLERSSVQEVFLQGLALTTRTSQMFFRSMLSGVFAMLFLDICYGFQL